MIQYSKTERKLIDAMCEMDIIDAHEHLPPEQVHLESQQDVFTLFSHYTRCDLFSAGMSTGEWESLFDYDVPLEKRWEKFRPFWNAIRHGSYARASLLTAKMLYGFDDISDQTYRPLSEAIHAENTPGIYKRILVDRCRIRAALTQCARTDVDDPLVPVMSGRMLAEVRTLQQLEELAAGLPGDVPKDLDGCLDLIRAYLRKWVDEGAVGIKLSSHYSPPPDRTSADAACKRCSKTFESGRKKPVVFSYALTLLAVGVGRPACKGIKDFTAKRQTSLQNSTCIVGDSHIAINRFIKQADSSQRL